MTSEGWSRVENRTRKPKSRRAPEITKLKNFLEFSKLTRKGLCEAYWRDEPGPWWRGAFLLNVGPNFLDKNLLLFISLCPVVVVLVLGSFSSRLSSHFLPDRPHRNRRQTRHLVSFEPRPKAPSDWPFRPILHLEPSLRFYPRITAANSVGHRSKC